MNFDVNKALAQAGHPPVPPPKPTVQEESPVQRLQRMNDSRSGMLIDHTKEGAHSGLKSSEDADLEEILKELPGTMLEIQSIGNRIERAKQKLGLGEGGFLDQEMEILNYKTGQVEGREWRTSAQINTEFLMREPIMTDEQLEDFLKTYFVEFDLATGKVKPRKYPNVKGLKCSVTFPEEPAPAPDVAKSTATNMGTPSQAEPSSTSSPAPKTEPRIVEEEDPDSKLIKVKYRIEERTAGVRKKADRDKIIQLSEMVLDRNFVPCTAVASRYKCDISPITYAEFDQIRSMVETSKLARETKLWSLIYRHVKNPTIGEFKNFQDFCDKTAWIDRRRFWFALMCTMTRDTEKVSIVCKNHVYKQIKAEDGQTYDLTGYHEAYEDIGVISLLPVNVTDIPDMKVYTTIMIGEDLFRYIPIVTNPATGIVKWIAVEQMSVCDEMYESSYINRSLIDTDDQPKWVTDEIEKINNICGMNEAIAYHEEGSLMSKRIIAINDSISMEVGIKSVSDVLHNDYKYVLDDELLETMNRIAIQGIKEMRGQTYEPTPEDIRDYANEEMTEMSMVPYISMSVVSRLIATLNGEEYEIDQDTDIISMLNSCRPQDLSLIYNIDAANTIMYRYLASYEPTFSYKNCTCPKCGHKSNITIDRIEDLVFTLSRSLTTTTFDIADL